MRFILRTIGFALLAFALIMLLAYKANSHLVEIAVAGVLGGICLAVWFFFDNNHNTPAH